MEIDLEEREKALRMFMEFAPTRKWDFDQTMGTRGEPSPGDLFRLALADKGIAAKFYDEKYNETTAALHGALRHYSEQLKRTEDPTRRLELFESQLSRVAEWHADTQREMKDYENIAWTSDREAARRAFRMVADDPQAGEAAMELAKATFKESRGIRIGGETDLGPDENRLFQTLIRTRVDLLGLSAPESRLARFEAQQVEIDGFLKVAGRDEATPPSERTTVATGHALRAASPPVRSRPGAAGLKR